MLLSIFGFSALVIEVLDCVCHVMSDFCLVSQAYFQQVAVVLKDCAPGMYPSKASLLFVFLLLSRMCGWLTMNYRCMEFCRNTA